MEKKSQFLTKSAKPPKGVILYGEPGTGKTMLAKAVANNTKATFLRITASAMTAKENSPCILFIDEIDAIGSKRYDTSCGGEKKCNELCSSFSTNWMGSTLAGSQGDHGNQPH
uniref:ATPase AAA-type core domain-containing protein n=1 Tax=Ditylenchus dipsaci TaxID=166011 RepID=A0A915D7H8_9BILA